MTVGMEERSFITGDAVRALLTRDTGRQTEAPPVLFVRRPSHTHRRRLHCQLAVTALRTTPLQAEGVGVPVDLDVARRLDHLANGDDVSRWLER